MVLADPAVGDDAALQPPSSAGSRSATSVTSSSTTRRVARLRELEAAGLGRLRDALREPARLLPLQRALRCATGSGCRASRTGSGSGTTGRSWPALRAFRRARREARAEPRPGGSRAAPVPRGLVEAGQSLFLFLRTERLRSWLARPRGGRRAAEPPARPALGGRRRRVRSGRPVFLVPIALFWRKGPRTARRVLNLAYGAPTRPSDVAKVTALPGRLPRARREGRRADRPERPSPRSAGAEGADAIVRARCAARSCSSSTARSAWWRGPTLLPRHRVQELVLQHPEVTAAIERRGAERRIDARSRAGGGREASSARSPRT